MRDFLDFLQGPEGYVEIRSIRDGKVRQWWEKDRQAAVDLALAQSDEGWDAYYGVLPRLERAGDSSAISPMTSALWADLDAKTIGSKQQALMSLVRFEMPPSVVVDSGHGYHAYWKLRVPYQFAQARMAMVGLARQLNGDHVYDQARILRIPGTVNWKDRDEPMPVRTVVFNTTQELRFSDFYRQTQAGIDALAPPKPRPGPRRLYDHDDLPDWLDRLIQDGAPQGQRSEQAFKVMCQLAKRGWSDAEIKSVFETGGIGEKMREMRSGDRWFDHSMKKARLQA
jgi:hypothetical protein